jgi:hypothetical protein
MDARGREVGVRANLLEFVYNLAGREISRGRGLMALLRLR